MFVWIVCGTCGNSGNVPNFMEVHACSEQEDAGLIEENNSLIPSEETAQEMDTFRV